jgi:hypothetical protein
VPVDRKDSGWKRYRVFLKSKKKADGKWVYRSEVIFSEASPRIDQVVRIGRAGWVVIAIEKEEGTKPQLGDIVL